MVIDQLTNLNFNELDLPEPPNKEDQQEKIDIKKIEQ